jgi:hypothetical protein
MEERDWSTFACPNPDCSTFGQRGGDNLRPHGWSSKARNIRCLRCTACGRHFSARAGTPLFPSHLTEDQAVQIAHAQGRHSQELPPALVAPLAFRHQAAQRLSGKVSSD